MVHWSFIEKNKYTKEYLSLGIDVFSVQVHYSIKVSAVHETDLKLT